MAVSVSWGKRHGEGFEEGGGRTGGGNSHLVRVERWRRRLWWSPGGPLAPTSLSPLDPPQLEAPAATP